MHAVCPQEVRKRNGYKTLAPGILWWDLPMLAPSFGGGSLQRVQQLIGKLNSGKGITVGQGNSTPLHSTTCA